jgi:homoserine trans-succinylase
MGLDMYLHKNTYVKNWEHMKPEQKHQITILKDGEPSSIQTDRISSIQEEVAYWRKANQIHQWFVDNVQNGDDNCGDYYVSRENLADLLELTEKVLDSCELIESKVINGYSYDDNNKRVPMYEDGKIVKDSTVAEELLPSTSGFFFGGTEYDQWYVEQLEYTRDTIKKLLTEDGDGDFEYHSSW